MFYKENDNFFKEKIEVLKTRNVAVSILLSVGVILLWLMPLEVLARSEKGRLMNYFSVAFLFFVIVNFFALLFNFYLKLNECCATSSASFLHSRLLHFLTLFGASPANVIGLVSLQCTIKDKKYQSTFIKLILLHALILLVIYNVVYFSS